MNKDHSVPHGDSEFFSLSHARFKTKNIFHNSLPSSNITISNISIYKHYAIDIADPSSMQDARDCTKNIFLNSLPSSKLTISTISKGHCVTVKKCIGHYEAKSDRIKK